MTTPQGANLYTLGFGSRPENVEIPVYSTVAPSTTNINYPVGKRWINTSSNTTYTLTSLSTVGGVTSAVWTSEGGGTTALATLTGDSGVAVPVASNINVLGTTDQIITTGASPTGDDLTIAFSTPNFTLTTTEAKLEAAAPATSTLITSSNTDNTDPASGAGFNSLVGGASAGDAYHFYEVTGGQAWIHGIDNSDSDAFVLSAATALGTSNVMRFSTAGDVSMPLGDLSISRAEVGGAVLETIANTDNTNGASSAQLSVETGGATAGDPSVKLTVTGVQNWIMGVDNSDSDLFKVSASAALGTTDVITLGTAGNMRVALGDIQVTNGDLFLETAGNKLGITTGANASIGQATLAGGTVTVNTTAVTASSLIFISRASIGATGAAATGNLVVGTITAATSFVINSVQAADATVLQASDVSVVNWWIIN